MDCLASTEYISQNVQHAKALALCMGPQTLHAALSFVLDEFLSCSSSCCFCSLRGPFESVSLLSGKLHFKLATTPAEGCFLLQLFISHVTDCFSTSCIALPWVQTETSILQIVHLTQATMLSSAAELIWWLCCLPPLPADPALVDAAQ